MRIRIFVLIILGLLAAMALAPFFTAPACAQATTKIVCTNSALADYVGEIMGSNAEVEYIMPAGACPSHFDTRPSDVSVFASADIVVSLGWEAWLTDLLTASGNTGAHQVKCLGLGEWNIPSGAKAYVDKIADGLGNALPGQNDTIHSNAATYKGRIDAKAAELQSLVQASGHLGKQVACMEWQMDFVEWLGFDVVSYYGPPEGLSTADVLNVTGTIEENDVVAIIDNMQSGTEFGANIASETGAAHVVLTNFPGAVPGTDTYLDMIEFNTGQLLDGISTFEHNSEEIESLQLQRTVFMATTIIFAALASIALVLYKRKG